MKKYIQKAELCSKNYDHREIGKKQNLFSFHSEGPGLPFFHPKGVMFKNILMDFWRKEHLLAGYEEIESPMMLNKDLWVQSGHWDLFRENMYISEVDKGEFVIKPMNCPGAMLYYKEKKRSFKELPLRICELGKVHRNENSGSLHGLLRVRSFVVDDAHIFCSEDQLKSEVKKVLNLCLKILKKCGFHKFDFELSLRSEEKKEKYLGSDQDWDFAQRILQESLDEMGLNSKKIAGEAKFYGPAIDIKINDSRGRSWQCSSIQMDFNLSKRFKLGYFDKSGKRKIPYILHRCVFGSLERFIGILLEHYQGKLPLWLAPIQVKIISLGDHLEEYGRSIGNWLDDNHFRYQVDFSNAHLSYKIKQAIKEEVPIVIIIGDEERKENKISIRLPSGEQKKLVKREVLLDRGC